MSFVNTICFAALPMILLASGAAAQRAQTGAEYVFGELARRAREWAQAADHFAKAAQLNSAFADARIGWAGFPRHVVGQVLCDRRGKEPTRITEIQLALKGALNRND